MLKKFFVMFCLLVVMRVPLPEWTALSEKERDYVRAKATQEHMKGWEKGTIARIWEEIQEGKWELHIEATDRYFPQKKKESI
jgi:hypothetical protein